MAKAPTSSSSKVISLMIIVVFLIGCWFVAPLFLPMWRWQNVDFHQISQKYGKKEKVLATVFDVKVRYHPRGNNSADPVPYQLVEMNPAWHTVDETNENEDLLAVRCTFISDTAGSPPPGIYVGSTGWDRFFKAKAWRLPDGFFGFRGKRPVILYRASSLEKISKGEAADLDATMKDTYENDDDWEEREDIWP